MDRICPQCHQALLPQKRRNAIFCSRQCGKVFDRRRKVAANATSNMLLVNQHVTAIKKTLSKTNGRKADILGCVLNGDTFSIIGEKFGISKQAVDYLVRKSMRNAGVSVPPPRRGLRLAGRNLQEDAAS